MTFIRGAWCELLKPGLMKEFGYTDEEIEEYAKRNEESEGDRTWKKIQEKRKVN